MMFPFDWNMEPRTVLDTTYDFLVVKIVTKPKFLGYGTKVLSMH